MPQEIAGICHKCSRTRPAFFALRSCAVYKEPLRAVVLKLKYRGDFSLGEALAWDLGLYLDGLGWRADIEIPIPLSGQRMRERGYNQVDMIAHPLARLIGWRYLPRALWRSRHTRSQVGLSAVERHENVLGAFQAAPRYVAGKTVLLVDDTTTTGATLDSASMSLLDAGAARVYALTLARALRIADSEPEKPLPARPLR